MNKQTVIVLLVVAGAVLLYFQFFGRGKPHTPPPPAAVLKSQAQSLAAKGDYKQAVAKYAALANTYKNTPEAAEAIFQESQIDAYRLHTADHDAQAMALVNTLATDYRNVSFPDKAKAAAERAALGRTLDYFYSHSDRSIWYTLFIPYKYLYRLMNFFVDLTGARSYSYWIALVLISVIVRLVLTPLTIKQYKGMREMQRLQPLVKEVQEKYKGDRSLLNTKTMELYREHNVNPAAGCAPMIIQLPVFSAMYWAVRVYQYHFAHGTFLWIGSSISRHYPQFLGTNLSEQDIPLLLIYSASMYLTQRMMPVTDPSQAEMQRTTALMMSVFFFIMFQGYHFPSAFVLYWLVSNILSTLTQLYFTRSGNYAPQGTRPLLPSDGGGQNGSGLNGRAPQLPSSNGVAKKVPSASGNGAASGGPPAGASRGVMAPKVHPKKKKR